MAAAVVASSTPILHAILAHDIDQRVVAYLHQYVQGVAEDVLGGRRAVAYEQEIKLLTSVLYYQMALRAGHRTVGQEYCSLKLVWLPPQAPPTSTSPQQFEAPRPHTTTTVQQRFRVFSELLPLIYALIPYLQARKDSIYAFTMGLWRDLVAPEPDSDGIDNSLELTALGNRSHASGHDMVGQRHSQAIRTVTALWRAITQAWRTSWLQLADDDSERLNAVLGYWKEFYVCCYLLNGRFYEIALQCCGFRAVPASPTAGDDFPVKLRAVGWLVVFKLSVTAAEYLKSLLYQFVHEVRSAATYPSTEHPADTAESAKSDVTSDQEQGDSDTGVKCPLCMEAIAQQAACTPCGHLFHWGCMGALPTTEVSNGSKGGGYGCKCPVCRADFLTRHVRAIYSYG